jgi:hypothetical protein
MEGMTRELSLRVGRPEQGISDMTIWASSPLGPLTMEEIDNLNRGGVGGGWGRVMLWWSDPLPQSLNTVSYAKWLWALQAYKVPPPTTNTEPTTNHMNGRAALWNTNLVHSRIPHSWQLSCTRDPLMSYIRISKWFGVGVGFEVP